MINKQLGQTQTAALTDTLIYTLPAGTEATNLVMTVANVTGTADDFTIYQDDDGSVHTAATALYFGVAIEANSTVKVNLGPMSNFGGTIYVMSTTLNAVTFTLHGVERQIA